MHRNFEKPARSTAEATTDSDGTQPAVRSMDEPAAPAGSVLRSPFLWAFLGGVILLTLIRPMLRREPALPPVLGQVPAFTLVSETGEPFGSADLAGQVYVANFIFTRCVSICPILTAAMHRLQDKYDEAGVDEVHLVSISVDPEYDTPQRLREYGMAHGVDPGRWTMLTGATDDVRQLITEGFHTPLGEPTTSGELIDIAHTAKFVLVDGNGAIRGYYDSDSVGLDEIFHRSRHVLRESGRRR